MPAKGADKRAFAESLAELLNNETHFVEMVESLPSQAREALSLLKQEGGQMPWAHFSKRFGSIRAMGPAKRDREKPWYFPDSSAEHLYYRALIGREFIRLDEDLVETAFIPDEFLSFLPDVPEKKPIQLKERLSRQAKPKPEQIQDLGLQIVDDYCTLFAALRLGEAEKRLAKTGKPAHYWRILRALGDDLGLLGRDGLPTDLARALLERPKVESAAWLHTQWAHTRLFNEMRLTPALRCEGGWHNEPLPVRRRLLTWLGELDAGEWYLLADFIKLVAELDPDFLRQGADYELWFVYGVPSGALLKGTESWHDLEAVFLTFFVVRWMFFLGLVSRYQDENGQFYFSLKPAFQTMMQGAVDQSEDATGGDAEDPLVARSNGLILMTDKTAPIARYQVARFAEWMELGPKQYRYQITPTSLASAAKAKLSPRHLISLLRKYGRSAPPPVLVKALNRWQEAGGEASLEKVLVLRLASPDILQALKQSPAKAWLGDSLGPVSVLVKAGGLQKVQEALARLGYLSDYDVEGVDE